MMVLIYVLAGIFAGLSAGMLGVGGGIVVVPALIFVFESQGFAPSVLMQMAIATSLAVMVFTSASSVWNHHRAGNVDWPLLRRMMRGLVPGVVLGVVVAANLDGYWLKKLFGVFACHVAVKMWLQSGAAPVEPNLAAQRYLPVFGFVISTLSTLLGIGGGTLSVPLFNRLGIEMRRGIGTAAAVGLPIAIVGAAGNMLAGAAVAARPEWSLGFIYLPALLWISVCSVLFTRIGVTLSQQLPIKRLRQIFAVVLMLVGLRFLLL